MVRRILREDLGVGSTHMLDKIIHVARLRARRQIHPTPFATVLSAHVRYATSACLHLSIIPVGSRTIQHIQGYLNKIFRCTSTPVFRHHSLGLPPSPILNRHRDGPRPHPRKPPSRLAVTSRRGDPPPPTHTQFRTPAPRPALP